MEESVATAVGAMVALAVEESVVAAVVATVVIAVAVAMEELVVVAMVAAVVAAIAIAGDYDCCLLYWIYYFIVVDILFYCVES